MKTNKKRLIYLILVFIIMLIWSYVEPYDFGPDEYMRYPVPEYIYNHGKLPLPDEPEVVAELFNASYAYYPTFLPAITSSMFMKIIGVFTQSEKMLVFAARLTNVFCAIVFIYFIMLILDELLSSDKAKWFGILFASLIPQFTFLSSYVNNDMMAIMASSIITYSWIKMIKDKVNFKNTIILSIGVILCALSYFNAYGWILCSIIIFVYCHFKKSETNIIFDYKNFFKYGFTASGIVLLFISFFFIRSYIVNNGDLLGMSSFLNACEESSYIEMRPSMRPTPQNIGMSYIELLFTNHYSGGFWFVSSFNSFIGSFGYLEYSVNPLIYVFYLILILCCISSFIYNYIIEIKENKKNVLTKKNKKRHEEIKFSKKEFNNKTVLYISLLLCMIIPTGLSIRYSYATDYQAQGRYLYPMFTSLILFVTLGYNFIQKILEEKIQNNNMLKVINYTIYALIFISYIGANITFFNSIK